MHIEKRKANTNDVDKLSRLLQHHTVDLLSVHRDGAEIFLGIGGLSSTAECWVVLDKMYDYIIAYAYDNKEMFETIDAYVWYYVESHAEEVLCDWAYRGYIYECAQCGLWQYDDHQYDAPIGACCSQDCVDNYWDNYDPSGKRVTIKWEDGTEEEQVFISFEETDDGMPWDSDTFFNMHGDKHLCVEGYVNGDGWTIISVDSEIY
jgi:hypothetical protein